MKMENGFPKAVRFMTLTRTASVSNSRPEDGKAIRKIPWIGTSSTTPRNGDTDDTLQAARAELAGQLASLKEQLQPMKDIRYWVGKVLTPEQTEPQKKPEPKHSITERLKYEQEQQKQTQEQKTPKQKKQHMEL